MKSARIVVLGVAIAAGGVAALLARGPSDTPQVAPPPAAKFDTVEVLVAGSDVAMGQTVKVDNLRWQQWPASAASSLFIRRGQRPSAIQDLSGSIARQAFLSGEPIREAKLIKAEGSGYLAAILPSGKRAASTIISPETGAGGFILPNDHVDVILSRRDKQAEKTAGVEVHVSETVLKNVRVLAIDQTVEEKNGQRVVVGRTATLELLPSQAEKLALAKQLGSLSLALRSLADSSSDKGEGEDGARRRTINTVRFGVNSVSAPR